MKVLFVICLQIFVAAAITVPPTWQYKLPSVPTTAVPNSDAFKIYSFFPSDAKPAKSVNKLQYRPPNNQQLFVYHSQPTSTAQHTPESYQIVHIDNQEDVPVKSENVRQPIRQHLTEVIPISSKPQNISNNEQKIPTQPIYPGEGQWAKYGEKHRPYIQPTKQPEKEIVEEDKPEGYDTFEKGEQQFNHAQNNFHHNLQTFPEKHQLPPSQITESESQSSPLYNAPSIGFTPEKLYTQVRRTETEEHLPRSAIDPEQEENASRLREVIKDSKIHTVYTEEGYEDSAYDHAGHEKNAENHEGYAEVTDKQQGSSGRRRRIENNIESNKRDDAEAAGTASAKNIKKVTMKNGNEHIDMDVYTEVKYTPQKKKHKYVKITPSVKHEKPLIRVKRYDKDKLSKRYVRKRPTYYWKKFRTTSSERPILNTRRKFESTTHEKPSAKPEITSKPTSTTSTPTTTPAKREEFLHPDLLNPELTTRVSKPAMPEVLPVKIRKFKGKRQKRYTNDFPNTEVDLKEFTDIRQLPEPTEAPDFTHVKYPYYRLPLSEELNEDSPLRYAEDMKNIPKKVENELSFYESREHVVCPEIPSNINPVPDRVQGEETDKMAAAPDLPRLKGLGDKIDCLKVKYFGENPLDSPFFQEEIIADPVPFFTIKNIQNTKKISPDFAISLAKTANKRELKIQILEPIVVVDDELIESATANPIHQNTEAVLKPPYTLTEMMTMNQEKILKLKPKSIYDQITILEQEDDKSASKKVSLPPTEKFIIIYDNQDVKDKMAKPQEKDVSSTGKSQETVKKPQIRKRPVNIIRRLPTKTIRKPPPKTILISSTTIPTTTATAEVPTTTVQPSPTTIKTALKPSQNIGRPPVPSINNWGTANRRITALYNIFDISRFLPKVPNHRLITSEVQYKDFIKPSEQMKVYSDVLQSIHNEKENKDTSDTKPVPLKVPVPNEDSSTPSEANKEVNVKPLAEEIIGMLPPSITGPYKTINNPDESSPTELRPQASKHINYYYFIGMRPPKQDKSYTPHYISKRDISKAKTSPRQLDNEDDSKFSPNYISRPKRHLVDPYLNQDDLLMDETENNPVYSPPPQRKPKVYTEIVRQRPSRPPVDEPADEAEEEDLNPRKRIYEFQSRKPSTTTVADLEEIATEPTTTQEPVIYPVEANSQNPNIAQYISFIDKIHEKWAKEDATSTTEATTTTAKTIVTQTAAERGEPAYLQIINQLHGVRNEEDAKTTTSSTTTAATTTEAHPVVPVKNSNPFILDRNTFMSEVNSMKAKLDPDNTAEGTNQETESRNRNYSARFKTNIDTSKYKTIERSPVNIRYNMSSRFNSDDEELPLQKEKTTQTPMIIAIISRPQITTSPPKESTVVPDSLLEETTNKEPAEFEAGTTTVRPRQRGRPRRPSTYTTTSTTSPIFRRRRPSRITTTQPSTTKYDSYYSRRRNRPKDVDATSTETVVVVTPVHPTKQLEKAAEVEELKEVEEPKKQRRFQKVQERHVMSEVTLTRFFEPGSDEQDDNSDETKKHQYEVIGPLTNTDSLHGGNYKHEDDRKPSNNEPFFTDPNLAENVNKLKDSKEASTEKNQASNSLLTKEELAEKVAQAKVNLYPNMARMVNRLAEKKPEVTTIQDDYEEETERPTFIKDPSRRMYYYAKL